MGYAMRRQSVAFTVFFLSSLLCRASLAEDDSAGAALPVVRLSPKIELQDRDRDYYQNIDCRHLADADALTEREKDLLAERKNQCLEHYRAFAPRSFQR